MSDALEEHDENVSVGARNINSLLMPLLQKSRN